jgi:hypothetical protein
MKIPPKVLLKILLVSQMSLNRVNPTKIGG